MNAELKSNLRELGWYLLAATFMGFTFGTGFVAAIWWWTV
jgi:hypothetical protein